MILAHISDVHVKNLSNHQEYRDIFNILFEKLKQIKPDVIILTGDLFHSKTSLSPEAVELQAFFLSRLAEIAEVIIIPGNHDLLLKNPHRQDAITPVVTALNNKNIKYFKKSQEYHINNDFCFNILSICDRDGWNLTPTDSNKINIALYHGSVKGSRTDLEWTMTNADDDIAIFEKFDFALLGDIHKSNQSLDYQGRCRYVGSTIQQNFSEMDDKGFLIWDIKSKDDFTVTHHIIPNPKPFVTIELNQNGTIPDETIAKPNSRMRLISKYKLPLNISKKAVEFAKIKFKPESIIFVDKSDDLLGSQEFSKQFKQEDLRDLKVQEKLINEYIKDYKPSEETLKNLYEINKKFNTIIVSSDNSLRHVDFNILKSEWNYLFNYGPNNQIDFSHLNGVVSLLGPNKIGKSNAIDSLLFTLFGGITKKNKKNLHVINYNSEYGFGKVTFQIGNKFYRVTRKCEKYIKKLAGNETLEAKTNLDFEEIDINGNIIESLNGLDRIETDKNIVKCIGSMDDFTSTSMTSQLGSLSFIDEGSTKRKEILAKFLDLDLFAQKFKLANDEIAELKSISKRLQNRNFDDEIKQNENELVKNNNDIELLKKNNDIISNNIKILEQDIATINAKTSDFKDEVINIDDINNKIESNDNKISNFKKEIIDFKNKIGESEQKLSKINQFVEKFDINSLNSKKELIENYQKQFNSILCDIQEEERNLKQDQKKVELLKEVPCGPEYSHCKFIKTAYEAKNNINIVEEVLRKHFEKKLNYENQLKELDPATINDQLNKFDKLLENKDKFLKDVERNKLLLLNKESNLSILNHELDKLIQKRDNALKNKESIKLINKKSILEKDLDKFKNDFEKNNKKIIDLYRLNGSLEQKLINLQKEKKEFDRYQKEYEAYELFLKCMHPSGISYDIIKNILPTINDEIEKNLSNIVDFKVFFQNEENRLELYIENNKKEVLPLEMASVSQKMISAMAIRLAFIKVSSMPKSNIFILDEPGTSFDSELLDGFVRMLDLIKSHFKCIILISHLEILKDAADIIITIEQKNDLAHVHC